MCDPNTSLALQGSGAGIATVGSYFSALGQKTSLGAQANVADINAQMSEDEAQAALLAGQKEQQGILLKGAQTKSSQRTSLAANGVDLGVGSALNVQDSTDVLTQVDANQASTNAIRAAFGYRTQGVGYKNTALLDRAQASSVSPWLAAGGTLLTSASSIATSRYMLQKSGALNNSSTYGPNNSWLARNVSQF